MLAAFVAIGSYGCNKVDDQFPLPLTGPDVREAFIGTYVVRDSMWSQGTVPPPYYYVLSISLDETRPDTLIFNHLSSDTASYIGILTGTDFSITDQPAGAGFMLNGQGGFTDSTVYYETVVGGKAHFGYGFKQ